MTSIPNRVVSRKPIYSLSEVGGKVLDREWLGMLLGEREQGVAATGDCLEGTDEEDAEAEAR